MIQLETVVNVNHTTDQDKRHEVSLQTEPLKGIRAD